MNTNSSKPSAGKPLLKLQGKTIREMSDEELRQHLQEMREVMSRAEELKKSAKAFLSDIRSPLSLCRDHPIPSLHTTESPLAETKRFCVTCGKALSDRPAIFVNGVCYCFFHAKLEYPKALAQRHQIEADLNAGYNDLMVRYSKRKQDHEDALRSWQEKRFNDSMANGFSGTPKWLSLGVVVVGLWNVGPLASVCGALVGLLTVTCIEDSLQEKRNVKFDIQFPKPDFSDRPPEYHRVAQVILAQHPENNEPRFKGIGYDRRQILNRDDCRCQNCGKVFQSDLLEVHHVEPIAKGGSDSERNLVTLCLKCHLEEDWFGHVHKMRGAFGL